MDILNHGSLSRWRPDMVLLVEMRLSLCDNGCFIAQGEGVSCHGGGVEMSQVLGMVEMGREDGEKGGEKDAWMRYKPGEEGHNAKERWMELD
jgi:hypothetical protein